MIGAVIHSFCSPVDKGAVHHRIVSVVSKVKTIAINLSQWCIQSNMNDTLLSLVPNDIALIVYRYIHMSYQRIVQYEYLTTYYEWFSINTDEFPAGYFLEEDTNADDFNSTEFEYDDDGQYNDPITVNIARSYVDSIYARRRLDNVAYRTRIDDFLCKYARLKYTFEDIEDNDGAFNHRDLSDDDIHSLMYEIRHRGSACRPEVYVPINYVYSAGCNCDYCIESRVNK